MWKVVLLFNFFFLCSHGLAGAGQEFTGFLSLHEPFQDSSVATAHSDLALAASVSDEYLDEISGSVLKAETWLRSHVLFHYPSSQISTIVVGDTIFCDKDMEETKLGLLLPSLKNIHHSLTWWGLEKDIKLTVALSPNCMNTGSDDFPKDGLSGNFHVQSLLDFLEKTNSSLSFSTRMSRPSSLSDEASEILSSHAKFVRKFGFLRLNKVNILLDHPRNRRMMQRRRLSLVEPYPERPTPLPEITQSPLHPSVGYSIPATIPRSPHHSPKPEPFSPPPPFPLPFAPKQPPLAFAPAMPPFGFTLPPCNPAVGGAPPPEEGGGIVVEKQRLWCVAKPSVPEETLQEAMDYACGKGGADCEEIMPNGSCFYPDTVIAHASYAFNSYWQKNKRNGGTCNFGGTAMIINSDPSFLQCLFLVN